MTYFNLIHSHYSTQYLSISDKFKEQLSSIESFDTTTATLPILSLNISSLYPSFKQMNSTAQKLLDQLLQDIINPLDGFHKNQSQIYNDITTKFHSLIDQITKTQRSVDNSKFIYYNSCFLSKQKSNEKNQRIHLTKANNEQLYQYEYLVYTKIINASNMEYENLLSEVKQNEESRIYFIKYIVDKYTKIITEYQEIISKMIMMIRELFSTQTCEDELQSIIKKLNINQNSNQISIEKYISFEEYTTTIDESNSPFNFEIIASSEVVDDQKVEKTISQAKEDLLSAAYIDINLISLLIKYLRNNPNATAKMFLDSFSDKEWYQFTNHFNFNCIFNVILLIDNSINEEKQDETKNKGITDAQYAVLLGKYSINKKIINVTQKIYFEKVINSSLSCPSMTKEKIYLSALISKKDLMYNSKGFWKEMINMTIANKVNNHLISSTSTSKQSQKEENEIDSNQISHMSRARTLISYASTSVSSSIMSRIWPANDMRTKGVVFKMKICSFIPSYSKLSPSDINSIEEIVIETIKKGSLLKKFITHMSHFNYPIDKIIELITEIGEEAKLSKDLINYLISFSNANWYTIKKYLPNDNNNNSYHYLNNYRLTSKERRIQLITYGLDYLEWKDYFVLFQLNKVAYKKLSNKIFKKALQKKQLNIETRLKIWYSILKIVSSFIIIHYIESS